MSPDARSEKALGARERILETAYSLFAHHGVRAIGIDRIVSEAGVAKMSLYRHFPSKTALVLAFLERRDELWTQGWLQGEIERRAATPADRVLGMYDLLDEWFRSADFESCSFLRTLLETPEPGDPVHDATVFWLGRIREMLAEHAGQAGIEDADEASYKFQMLMMGAIVSATRGDREAAQKARAVAANLLESSH